ncbi:MAG TPA: HEPN domain-containing protein [Anaerolineales bacterium]|nr:HEPN domain-containing protein [Anaerolineales bacterium]
MKETTQQLFARAADAIEAADILLTNDKTDIAAGRAYYAMFYTAEALLNEKEFKFGKHGNVIGAYGQHFAKTGELDPKFHRWLLTAFDQRQIGDYVFDPNVEKSVVVQMIIQAQEFLEAAKKYLSQQ